MMRIVSFFHFNKIKTQILCAVAIITLVMSLFTAVIIYSSADKEFNTINSQVFLQNLQTYGDILYLKLNPIIQNERNSVFSKTVLDSLYAMNSMSSDAGRVDSSSIWAVSVEMKNLIFQEPDIQAILVFDENGHYVFNSREYDTFEYDRTLHSHPDFMDFWYSAAKNAHGKEVFFGNNIITGDQNQFSFIKAIRDPDSLMTYLGTIVFIIDKRVIRDIFSGRDSNQNQILIYDNETDTSNSLVYQSGSGPFPTDTGEMKNVLENPGFITTSYRHSLTNWTFIGIIDKNQITSSSNTLLKNTAYILFSIFALTVFFSFFLSSLITRPLHALRNALNKFDSSREPITAVFDHSELGEMSTYIKTIVNNYISLSDKLILLQHDTQEAKLKALQAQINPHFLYNALNLIYTMALINGADEIAAVTEALSDIFKLTLSKDDSVIPLCKELEYIQKYMLIQQYRFSNEKIHLIIECPEKLSEYPIPKFLIQPLVENAILHGIEPKVGECILSIICQEENDFTVVTVKDDGIGVNDQEQFLKGYGLKNIEERIHLLYGEQYGINIKSELNMGTEVSLLLPSKKDVYDIINKYSEFLSQKI